ncbi:hypothetical protein LCGC14_3054130 [marine sediment metagenome]|uniref:Uncharacterized protein n=1 Tax=marine sediment metagenome TaxID=412755 RepID=A0A0F8YTQ5_9ZZZZ
MLGNLIGGFIVILVGVNLMPTIADGVWDTTHNQTSGVASEGSVTGSSATILDLVTLFFAIGVMAAGISLAVSGLRNAGLV